MASTLNISTAAENVILGGGRYDKLSLELGGPDVGGIGFGSGIERVLLNVMPLVNQRWRVIYCDLWSNAAYAELLRAKGLELVHLLLQGSDQPSGPSRSIGQIRGSVAAGGVPGSVCEA